MTTLTTFILALIAFIASIATLILQMRKVHDSVAEELIKQRIKPYAKFLNALELSSSQNCNKEFDDKSLESLEKALHSAIYGEVGLLAEHLTRQLLVYTRMGCREYRQEKNEKNFDNLMNRRWVVLSAMRSDLGIAQPALDDVLKRIGEKYARGIEREYSRGKELPQSDVEELVKEFSETVGVPGYYLYPLTRSSVK